MKKNLYIFIDESGNLDFSPNGTKYFTLTGLVKERPFYADKDLLNLKYDLIEQNKNIEYFHASEDRQMVRDKVFNLIKKYLKEIRIHSLIVEKIKVHQDIQRKEKFFPELVGLLLKEILSTYDLSVIDKVIVVTDTIPVKRQKNIMEKSIKKVLVRKLGNKINYSIFHHASKSNCYLQFVDYCNWAIYRKWEKNDIRSYELIRLAICSEIDVCF